MQFHLCAVVWWIGSVVQRKSLHENKNIVVRSLLITYNSCVYKFNKT